MISFLFWNLNKQQLQSTTAKIAWARQVDVIMLVECNIAPNEMLKTLNKNNAAAYHYSPNRICEKVEVFSRFPASYISPVFETERLTVRHLKLPGLTDALLAITHLPSKQYMSEPSQMVECIELSESILLAEKQIGHSRTILVGDLNVNPFEDGVVSAKGLHAIMSRTIAEERAREVQSREYQFFYNPMWNLFGDIPPGPPGTYFYRGSEYRSFFWNMFDQVLIRPDLIPMFDLMALEILQSDGNTSLLSGSGFPDKKNASDHLPIYFTISL